MFAYLVFTSRLHCIHFIDREVPLLFSVAWTDRSLLTYTLTYPLSMLTCGRYVNTTYGERLKVIKAKPCRQESSEIIRVVICGHQQTESGAFQTCICKE